MKLQLQPLLACDYGYCQY